MRRWLLVLALCGCLLAGVTPLAQDIPSDEFIWDSGPYFPESNVMFRANNTLIEAPTVVRDRSDRPVAGMTKDDFQLFDNGKPQTITSFTVLSGTAAEVRTGKAPAAPGSNAAPPVEPRYVALFLDDVNTPGLYQDAYANLTFARDAAEKFIGMGIDPGERIGIFTVSGDLTVDFTDDAGKLLEALKKLRLKSRWEDQSPNSCPKLESYEAWAVVHIGHQTREWESALKTAQQCGVMKPGDAAILAERAAEEKTMIADIGEGNTLSALGSVIRHLGEMPGRRMLVLASSGFVTQSFRQRQQRVIDAATSSRVIINSLNTTGLPYGPTKVDKVEHFSAMNAARGGVSNPNNDAMADMAYATGGLFYHNNNDLATGFHELAKAPVSYVLGFSPENLKSDGNYHRLKVKLVEAEHRSVDARPGYYAPGGDPSAAEDKSDKLNRSVTGTDDRAEIPIVLTANASESGVLKVAVHVDAAKLPYKHMSGRHIQRLVFVTALFDESDRFLSAVEGVMQLQLKDDTLAKVSAHGFDAKLSISAPPGKYRVRQVVQEIEGGHVASLSRPVTVR